MAVSRHRTDVPFDAWKIRSDDFPKAGGIKDQKRFLLNYAVLAPSGHNSQP